MSELTKLYNELRDSAAQDEYFAKRILVLGEGNEASRLLLIGEAPGGEEERLVRPFVGSAGKNLDEFLSILGQKREEIYITNLVKVRPTKLSDRTGQTVNRPPDSKEVAFFIPYLYREIEIIAPTVVVTLGNFSLKAVLRDENAKISALHGRSITFAGKYKLFPLYHPAAIIYKQDLKETYYHDLERLKLFISKLGL